MATYNLEDATEQIEKNDAAGDASRPSQYTSQGALEAKQISYTEKSEKGELINKIATGGIIVFFLSIAILLILIYKNTTIGKQPKNNKIKRIS